MPRIPSTADLRTVSPGGTRVPLPQRPAPVPVDPTGEALEGLGTEVRRLGEEYQQRQEEAQRRDERLLVERQKTRFRSEAMRSFLDQRAQVGPGFAESFDKQLQEQQQSTLKSVRERESGIAISDESFAELTNDLDNVRLQFFGRAADLEFHERRRIRKQEFDSALNEIENVVATDHTQLAQGLLQASDLMNSLEPDLQPAEAASFREDVEQRITSMAVRGLIQRGDYEVAEEIIDLAEFESKEKLQLQELVTRERERVTREARAGVRNETRSIIDNVSRGENIGNVDSLLSQARSLGMSEEAQTLERARSVAAEANEIARMDADSLGAKSLELRDEFLRMQDQGASEEAFDRNRMLREATANTVKSLQDDAYRHAVRHGVIDRIPELDLSTPDAFEESLKTRRVTEEAVETRYGVNVPTLQKSEVQGIENLLKQDSTTPTDALGLLRAMKRNGGPEIEDAFVTPALSVAMDLSDTQRELAEDIVLGLRDLKREGEALRLDSSLRHRETDLVLGDAYRFRTDMRQRVIEAADAAYAHRLAAEGTTADANEVLYGDLLNTMAGAPFEYRGSMVVPPDPSVTPTQFEVLLGTITQKDLSFFGNGRPIAMDGSLLTPDALRRSGFSTNEFTLALVDKGMYAIQDESGNTVMSSGGGPYIIDLFELWKSRGVGRR